MWHIVLFVNQITVRFHQIMGEDLSIVDCLLYLSTASSGRSKWKEGVKSPTRGHLSENPLISAKKGRKTLCSTYYLQTSQLLCSFIYYSSVRKGRSLKNIDIDYEPNYRMDCRSDSTFGFFLGLCNSLDKNDRKEDDSATTYVRRMNCFGIWCLTLGPSHCSWRRKRVFGQTRDMRCV